MTSYVFIGSIAFRHNLCLIIYSCITMWLKKINVFFFKKKINNKVIK